MVEYGYDARGRLVSLVPGDGSGALRFSYDGAGNPLGVVGVNDLDGDGMDDEWEAHWFGGSSVADATTDADGDGSPDAMEFASGTLPLDAQSRLVVDSPGETADGVWVLRWPSVRRCVYSVYAATNLAGPWSLAADGLEGTDGAMAMAVTSLCERVFFRISVGGGAP